MGQGSSQDSCCASRGAGKKEDEPRRGAEIEQRPTRNDGGSRDYDNETRSQGGDGLCNVSCVTGSRSNGASLEKANELFGEKALRPNLAQLAEMEEEVELLEKVSAQATQKASGTAPLRPEAVTSGASGPQAVDLWAKLILQGDAAMKGTPVALLVEACVSVLGSAGRPIPKEDVETRYSDILSAVAELAQTRSGNLRADIEALLDRLSDIEDMIIKCFEKIDEHGEDFITKYQFVRVMCDPQSVGPAVNPKDAASLFDRMTKDDTDVTEEGEKKLTFERFKEEITEGGLQTLARNLEENSMEVKKYRDWMM